MTANSAEADTIPMVSAAASGTHFNLPKRFPLRRRQDVHDMVELVANAVRLLGHLRPCDCQPQVGISHHFIKELAAGPRSGGSANQKLGISRPNT